MRFNKLDSKKSSNERFNFNLESSSENTAKSKTVFEEMKMLIHLSWPLIFVGMFRFANPMISIIICGKLSKVEFDAAALANSIISVFGVSIDLGFSTSCDTLFSQVYCSKNRSRMGFILQRAMIVMTIIYFMLCCIHINIEPILILFQQDFQVCRLTARYALFYLPGLFFDFQFLAVSRYLQNQNVSVPIMVSSFIGSLFSGVTQYVAISLLEFGLDASAVLQASGCLVMFLVLVFYVIISKVYSKTWLGFNLYEALREWRPFFKYGIPGIVMLGIEQWAYESMSFVAGYLSVVELGGQTIAFQVEMFSLTISIGLGVSVLVRVGHNLGFGNSENILRTIKVAFCFGISVSVVNAIIIFFGRKAIAQIFTNDLDILKIGTKLLMVVSIFQFLDAICSVSGGILRACGKQLLGAIIMTITNFAIGIPLGMLFIFVGGMDIIGMWFGLAIGYLLETIIFLVLVLKTNWENEIEKVRINNAACRNMDKEYDETKFGNFKNNEENRYYEDEDDKNEADILLYSKRNENIFQRDKKRLFYSRSIQIGFVLLLLVAAVLLRILLPPSLYIPCIKDILSNSSDVRNLINRNYPLCNDSKIFG